MRQSCSTGYLAERHRRFTRTLFAAAYGHTSAAAVAEATAVAAAGFGRGSATKSYAAAATSTQNRHGETHRMTWKFVTM